MELEAKLDRQCLWETGECDLATSLHTGYFSPAVFGGSSSFGRILEASLVDSILIIYS